MRRFTPSSSQTFLSVAVRWCSGAVQVEIHPRGYQTQLFDVPATKTENASISRVKRTVANGENVVMVGAAATGKRTLLLELYRHLAATKKVAITSAKNNGCVELGGVLLSSFLGLKPNAEVVSVEAAAASMARHVRSMSSSFAHFLPCMTTIDVLFIDRIELVSPLVLQAFDIVAREERKVDAPFGGLQIVAGANFWRALSTPSSPFIGNLFQLPKWNEFFPPANQVPFWENFRHQRPVDTVYANKALFGTLTDADVHALEGAMGDTALIDQREAIVQSMPRFPKHPAVTSEPQKKAAIRSTAFGHFLCSLLVPLAHPSALSLRPRLHVEVGERVGLTHPMDTRMPAGAVGEVVEVLDHYIAVRYSNQSVVHVPRLRATVRHTNLPEICFTTSQFPLFKLCHLDASTMISGAVPVPVGVKLGIDARVLTNTNDLGNLLSILPTGRKMFSNIQIYSKREGFVHEPTRLYMERLLVRDAPDFAADIGIMFDKTADRWCKNCKAHVPNDGFWSHWDKCINESRWCADCGCTVPSAKWDAHCEKHTVVMCIDCGKALEWKLWDQHRLSCGAMLRELSTENELLPQTTKSSALEASIDRSDLHKVKEIARRNLPRSHKDVRESSFRARAI